MGLQDPMNVLTGHRTNAVSRAQGGKTPEAAGKGANSEQTALASKARSPAQRSVGEFPTVELTTRDDLRAQLGKYKATVLILGHGSKGQFADLPSALKLLDPVVASLDKEYGRGNWLVTFGGDPLKSDSPDVAQVVRYLQEKKGAPVLAVQSDKIKEWGGVDKHIDFVHYVPTKEVEGKIVWGGNVDGKPVGPTAEYLGSDFVGGPLKKVIAMGGGAITLDEVKLASKQGVPVTYVRAEVKNKDASGDYGPVDAWAERNRNAGVQVIG